MQRALVWIRHSSIACVFQPHARPRASLRVVRCASSSGKHHSPSDIAINMPDANKSAEPGSLPVENPNGSVTSPLIFGGLCAALLALNLVPLSDVAFAFGWAAYLVGVNVFKFNSNKQFLRVKPKPLVPYQWITQYAMWAAVPAILVPVVLMGINWGDVALQRLLAPHLFLICAQVLCEYFSYTRQAAILVRMLTPIGFNVYRLHTIVAWIQGAAAFGAAHTALAYINMILWTGNLLFLLLPIMLPLYLDPKESLQ